MKLNQQHHPQENKITFTKYIIHCIHCVINTKVRLLDFEFSILSMKSEMPLNTQEKL